MGFVFLSIGMMEGSSFLIVNRFVFGCSLILMTWAALLWGNSLGPPADRSGVSGVTCSTSGCHNDFPANVGGGSVSITGLPAEWTPGVTYPLQVSVSHSGASLYGFQMTGVDSNGAQAGGFVIGTGAAIQSGSAGGNTIDHIQHSFATTNSTFSFSWTAPNASSTGAVKFNVAANAANGNFSRFGDFIYSTETTVSPVTQTNGNGSAQTTFYFPQIADGTLAGGFFKTTIFVVNPASSGSANVTMTFTTSAGDPFNVSFVDSNNQPVGSGNVVTVAALAGGQSRKLISTAATPLTVGFATVTADAQIVASAVFSQFSGTPAQATLLSEAAVTSANTALNHAIFVDESGNFRTALAYANPSATVPANVTFNLMSLDTDSVPVLTTAPTALPANNHTSIFVDELFATDGQTNPLAVGHVGTMQVISDTPLALVSLRFEGSVFTSVPPFNLASLILGLETWARPVEAWAERGPWLSPLASLARLLGTLRANGWL